MRSPAPAGWRQWRRNVECQDDQRRTVPRGPRRPHGLWSEQLPQYRRWPQFDRPRRPKAQSLGDIPTAIRRAVEDLGRVADSLNQVEQGVRSPPVVGYLWSPWSFMTLAAGCRPWRFRRT